MSELEILKMVFDTATGTPIGEKANYVHGSLVLRKKNH